MKRALKNVHILREVKGIFLQFHCYHCQHKFEHIGNPSRGDECPKCQKDVRVCLNCRFFDDRSARQCQENQADLVSDKEKANFCGWFKPGRINIEKPTQGHKNALEALFSEPQALASSKQNEEMSLEQQLQNFMQSRPK